MVKSLPSYAFESAGMTFRQCNTKMRAETKVGIGYYLRTDWSNCLYCYLAIKKYIDKNLLSYDPVLENEKLLKCLTAFKIFLVYCFSYISG